MPKLLKKPKQKEYPSVISFLQKAKKDFVKEKLEKHIERAQFDKSDEDNAIEADVGEQTNQDNFKQKSMAAEKKLKFAKKLLRQSSGLLLEKDIQIKQLMERSIENRDIPNDALFAKHSNNFEHEELKAIRSTQPGFKNDSTFVLKIMRALYKGNELEKLKNRTATGRKYNGNEKREISFEKKDIIKEMLLERINDEVRDNIADTCKRLKRINDLIRSAIHNITRFKNGKWENQREKHHEIEILKGKEGKPNDIAESCQVYIYSRHFSNVFTKLEQ